MNIGLSKEIRKLLKVAFFISCSFLCLLSSSVGSNNDIFIGMVLSLFVGFFIVWKNKYIYREVNIYLLIVALNITIFYLIVIGSFASDNLEFLHSILGNNILDYFLILFMCAMALFSLLTIIYYGIRFGYKLVKRIFSDFNKFDKIYLVVVLILGFIATLVLYNLSSCFYAPKYAGADRMYDIIYTTDTGGLFLDNAYLHFSMPENDIRQPLFGVFASIFAIIGFFLSKVFWFVPNSYAIFLNTIQIFMLGFSFLLVMKMLKLKDRDKLFFILLGFSGFTIILFSFVLEQYITAFFYLILTIYIWKKGYFKINYFYVTAVGTLITSGIIFPLITKFKSFRQWICDVFRCFFVFCSFMILSGQCYQIFNLSERIKFLTKFTGTKILFEERFMQFLYFIRSMFVSPLGEVVFLEGLPRYHLVEVQGVSVLGLIILLVCLVSFIMNSENKLAIFSLIWIGFSFVILCVIGWGTAENGLILYALYFYWAYLVLIYLFIDKVKRKVVVRRIILILLVVLLLFYNIPGMLEIIRFGITFYGV